ncbi:MAG: leucine-rich repeat protein, partial [Clostridia bacterium]|nr:leucine-rich repeat protein [Clostridia bacterium]
FSGNAGLTSVTLPSSLTDIGASAFFGCAGLPEITLPDGVTSVGSGAFDVCAAIRYAAIGSDAAKALSAAGYDFRDPGMPKLALKYSADLLSLTLTAADGDIVNAAIPEGVTAIGQGAFSGNAGLTSVTLPSSLTDIGASAFFGCAGLPEITLPDGVTSVGADAFDNCAAIRFAGAKSDAAKALGVAGYDFRDPSAPKLTLKYDQTLFSLALTAADSDIAIAEVPEGVTDIAANVFSGYTGLTEVKLPDSLKTIGEFAFSGCSGLPEITIPDDVYYIAFDVFNGCDALRYAKTLKKSSKALGEAGYDYRDPSAPKLTLKYENSAYYLLTAEADVKIAEIPYGVNIIVNEALKNCTRMTQAVLPNTISSIGDSAFEGCNLLAEVNLPDSVTAIGYGTFRNCTALREIAIPAGITEIPSSMFSDCSKLTSVQLPDGLIGIREAAFLSCSSLQEIDIPDSVTVIGNSVFFSCSSLESIVIPDGVTEIDTTYLFYDCTSLREVVLPESITEIKNSMFYDCKSLTAVNIPAGVVQIESYAFGSCASLKEFVIPEGVRLIKNGVFSGCASLERIVIPEGVETIESNAFSECTSLKEIVLPESLTSIGERAFSSCDSLTSINIPEKVTSIGEFAFAYCHALTEVTIPGSVASIGANTFDGALNLKQATIMDGVTEIGSSAFSSCDELRYVFIPESVTTFGSDIFVYGYNDGVTIYCYEFSDADYWAEENNYKVVYVDDIDAIRTVSLTEDFEMACGEETRLSPLVFPNHDHPTVTWTSSDPSVVDVNDGLVTALAPGVATVTATVGSATASVEVRTFARATGFELPDEVWLAARDTVTLAVTDIVPAGAELSLTWASSDSSIATVDESGLVSGRKPGDATVTAVTEYGVTRQCAVHVCYPVTAIALDPASATLSVGETLALTANVTARTQSLVNHLVTFTSSDDTVATVDQSGLITAVDAGRATISVTSGNGVSAECEITVPCVTHDWGPVTYEWSADYSQATATHVCTRDSTHIETETAQAEMTAEQSPAEDIEGETRYTVTFQNSAFDPQSVTLWDIPALKDMNVLRLPAGLREIEGEAFMGLSCQAVIIPDGCTTIGARAFADCAGLIYVRIPASVTSIADDAFDGCASVRIDRTN